ncbi:hypothetical protein ACHAXR_008807 [Thalassiosira sp. AJA248-18]
MDSHPLTPPLQSSSPFGSAAALDVIVVVPRSTAGQCDNFLSSSSAAAPQSNLSPAKGVVASSDFFVSFPSGMAGEQQHSLVKSISRKSRSFFYSKSTSNLSNSRTDSSNSNNNSIRTSSNGGSVIEEGEDHNLEEGVEVAEDGNINASSHSTMSERGTACTEAHHTQVQFQLPPSAQQYNNGLNNNLPIREQEVERVSKQQRRGNVQIQINGRYIPQLDMIFSSKRDKFDTSSGSSKSDDGPSCRFVNGNGLRPSTDALNSLIEGRDRDTGLLEEELMEQRCTCHESIRNSPHHLCAQQKHEAQQQNQQSTKKSGGGSRQGSILNFGRNLLRYTLFSKKGIAIATAEAHLYLWKSSDSVIVSDVDGTVTKSDVRGVIDTVIQDRFEYCHAGICKFYHDILLDDVGRDNGDDLKEEGEEIATAADFASQQHQLNQNQSSVEGRKEKEGVGEVRFLYLSSRPVSLIGQTRKLILSLSQTSPSNNIYGLPPGPIFHHTGPLSSVLYAELVAKNIYEFKADVLARQVVIPFVAARGEDWRTAYRRNASDSGICVVPSSTGIYSVTEEDDAVESENDDKLLPRSLSRFSGVSEASAFWDDRLFLAGFGNKLTDAMAYEMAGIDRRDIYIIDKESRILCMGVDNGDRELSSSDRSVSNSSQPANMSITTNDNGVLCDQSEWSLPEVCCPGVAEGQILSELPSSARANNAPSSNTKTGASSIHSIELRVSDDGQPETSDSLPLSKTAVDVYITNDPNYSNTATSISKRSKIKQSIRAFSSKRSFSTKFPSFRSTISSNDSKSSTKKLYEGYGDPLLLDKVRERMSR